MRLESRTKLENGTALETAPDLAGTAGPTEPTETTEKKRRLPEGWPILAFLFGYPLWWALGIGPFLAIGLAVPLGRRLLRRRHIFAPRGTGLYLVFLAVAVLSVVMLHDQPPATLPSSTIGLTLAYAYRLGAYAGTFIVALYVANASDRELPRRLLLRGLSFLFTVTVGGGYLGLLIPHVSFKTPAELALPHAVAKNQFVQTIVHPGMAQIQAFLGYSEARPKAPFAYTNEWGAVFSLLLPFFVYGMVTAKNRRWRLLYVVVLLASVPPAVLSLNRGLWVALVIGVAFLVIYLVRMRQVFVLVAGFALLAVVGVAFLLSPLYTVTQDRLAHPHSNEGRSYLYKASIDGAEASPLVGWGGPRRSVSTDQSIAAGKSAKCPSCGTPDVGTLGTVWTVMFCQGFLGIAALGAFMLGAFGRSLRKKDVWSATLTIVMAIFIFEMTVYDQVPLSFLIVMIAIGLSWRTIRSDTRRDAVTA